MDRQHASFGRPQGVPTDSGAPRQSIRFVAASVLALLVVAFAATGEASACPVTQPTCALEDAQKTVDSTVDKVKDTAGDVTETVDDTAGETVDKVEDTVDKVEDTAGDVTETVDKTTDQVLNPTDPKVPTKPEVREPDKPGKPNGPNAERGETREKDRVKSHNQTRGDVRNGRNASGDPLGGLRDHRLATDSSRQPGLVEAAHTSTAMPQRPLESFSRDALDAVKKFAFPLLMTLVVGIFLLVQSRIDRRDPKLALAPLDHDMLAFE
jgi:hypothetical protein